MPDVLIEVAGDWIAHRKAEFVEAIHGALVETLRVPPEDKVVRLIEHAPENFVIPKHMGEKFTHIEIAMLVGRSTDAKRALYREIVRSLGRFGVPSRDVKVVLIEIPKENVGFRGGEAACDVDIGYETAI